MSADKAALRRVARNRRDRIPDRQRTEDSDRIRRRVLELPELNDASRVFVYASQGGEVETYTLIEDLLALHKSVAVPRIEDPGSGTMRAVPIRSLKQLAPRAVHFGLLEPAADAAAWGVDAADDARTLVVMPALAVSPVTGHRLGTGGGYYDRYLAEHPGISTAVLAFDEQLVDEIPDEPYDQPVQLILTPTRVVRIAIAGE